MISLFFALLWPKLSLGYSSSSLRGIGMRGTTLFSLLTSYFLLSFLFYISSRNHNLSFVVFICRISKMFFITPFLAYVEFSVLLCPSIAIEFSQASLRRANVAVISARCRFKILIKSSSFITCRCNFSSQRLSSRCLRQSQKQQSSLSLMTLKLEPLMGVCDLARLVSWSLRARVLTGLTMSCAISRSP